MPERRKKKPETEKPLDPLMGVESIRTVLVPQRQQMLIDSIKGGLTADAKGQGGKVKPGDRVWVVCFNEYIGLSSSTSELAEGDNDRLQEVSTQLSLGVGAAGLRLLEDFYRRELPLLTDKRPLSEKLQS